MANQDFEKIRVFKAGLCSNILAWNNRIGRYGSILLVSRTIVMINRDGRGISIQLSEVKFLDLLKTNYCESIYQGRFH